MTIATLHVRNAPEAYHESYWLMKTHGVEENSRNGPVITIPYPALLTIDDPQQRVVTDPDRNCNPFFHVMEAIWMFAGSDRVGFPGKFNSTYVNYAEADGSVHGAYGKRWRAHFPVHESGGRFLMDQIQLAIAMLKKDHSDRRVLLSMWDPPVDLGAKKRDLPCNTHIYLRVRKNPGTLDKRDLLDMTVCNRSNDLLWGMLGANVVHMTMLQELIAYGADLQLGVYNVFTNNLHIYPENDVAQRFLRGTVRHDPYILPEINPYDLLDGDEKVEHFFEDCEHFIELPNVNCLNTDWFREVAVPMRDAYMEKDPTKRIAICEKIMAPDWRLACRQWIERKILSSAT